MGIFLLNKTGVGYISHNFMNISEYTQVNTEKKLGQSDYYLIFFYYCMHNYLLVFMSEKIP